MHSPTKKQPYYKKDFFTKKHIFFRTIEIICIFARSKRDKNIKSII